MKTENPAVSVIIPNLNGLSFIDKCLKSVLSSNYENFEIIIVDGGSTDGSFELIRDLSVFEPRLKIIRSHRQAGAASDRNAGIRIAKGKYIVFLDNDTEVDANWISALTSVLESDISIGAAQSKILDVNSRSLLQHAGGYIIPFFACWIMPRGNGKVDKGQFDNIENICAYTCALAVKRDVLNCIGLFDHSLVWLGEDIDLSWRIWLSGYRVVLAPRSLVYHWSKSTRMRARMHRSRGEIEFHLNKNCLRLIVKNYEAKNVLKYLPLATFIMVFRSIRALMQMDPQVCINSLKGGLWNILELKSTIKERRKIQKLIRRAPDENIMKTIMARGTLFKVYGELSQNNNNY